MSVVKLPLTNNQWKHGTRTTPRSVFAGMGKVCSKRARLLSGVTVMLDPRAHGSWSADPSGSDRQRLFFELK